MRRIKSSVVSMAAYVAMLVFIFAGGAGAANCPPDEEVNLRWSGGTPSAYFNQGEESVFTVKIDGDYGGSYYWYASGPGTITPCSNGNQAVFTASSTAAGKVTIQCIYTYIDEQTGEGCSYYIHHFLYVYGVDMSFTNGGVLCKYGWYRVNLTTIPSTSGGNAQFVYDATEIDVIQSGSVPDHIFVQPLKTSASMGDVELTYNYILAGNVLHSDTVNLTVVDMWPESISTSSLELSELISEPTSKCAIGYAIDAPAAMTFNVQYSVRDRNNMLQYSSSQSRSCGSWYTEYWNGKNTSSGKYADLTCNNYTAKIALFYGGRSICEYSCPISVKNDDVETREKSFSQEVSTTLIDGDVEISIDFQGEWEVTDLDLDCLLPNANINLQIQNDIDGYGWTGIDCSISENDVMTDDSISYTAPLSTLTDGITSKIFLSVYGKTYLLKEIALDRLINVCSLVPDYDRNGAIDDADETRWNNNEIFRFWINDDNDDRYSSVSGNDLPGSGAPDAWYDNDVNPAVDGMRDLIDFFPVRISLDDALCDTDTYSYYLVQENQALNFVYTQMEGDNTSQYLTNEVMAFDMRDDETQLVWRKEPIDPFGRELCNQSFLNRIKSQHQAVILLEGNCATTKPLVLEIIKKSTGQVVASSELRLKISSVFDMIRLKYFREGEDAIGIPSNYPEEVVQGNDFVFLHGYNVSEPEGRATHAEVFKRMYQSGFSGRYWGVLWYGDPGALLGSHYHNAVVEAFSIAPAFRTFLESFSSPPDVAAHSLGNGVVGIALNDATGAGKLVRNYFALDAAMSLESFGDIRYDSYMAFPNVMDVTMCAEANEPYQYEKWTDYPQKTWASEWHLLFANDNDCRKELTWRDRCAGAVSRVSAAYNFYSSTEEVLRADNTLKDFWDCVSPVGEYSWQVQEWYKGVDSWLAETAAGGSTDCAGWGFVKRLDSMNRHYVSDSITEWNELQSPSWVAQQLDDPGYLEDLKSDPLFRQKPSILFGSNGSDYVNGTVGDYANTYTDLDEYIESWHSHVRNRDWLLAKAFPARSRPMGSTEIDLDISGFSGNINMASGDENGLMQHGWPRTTTYNDDPEWRHGDYKDVAYTYVQELYKTWVRIINEEEN